MTDNGFETLGEVLDRMPLPTAPTEEPTRFVPAVLDGTPVLPPDGIYFGMPEEEYHALPALSSHGIRKLAASPMLFWASSTFLSERRRDEVAERLADPKERAHLTIGKAYHCRIMEGAEEFARRFAVELTAEDCEGALATTEQIKAAIAKHMTPDTRKAALPGSMVPVKPVAKVEDTLPDSDETYMRSAVKSDWIEQLRELEPDAKILDILREEHRAANAGKLFVSADVSDQLEVAAKMVEADPEVRHAFTGGHAEVVLIWHCARTGVPMKCRVDYLKLRASVDLKTVANQSERSIEEAIRFEIARYKYNIQPSVYDEGVRAVRQLVRDSDGLVAWQWDYIGKQPIRAEGERHEWARKWAAQDENKWLWVFQQKGAAPITRGVFYPMGGTTRVITDDIVLKQKRRFRQFSEAFGLDPWLDVKPIYDLADEDLPPSATEI